jgi:transcriptional/translational regulatory protein YebC/TACO1
MFERKGLVQVTLEKNTADLDRVTESLIEAALGAEAEDFDQQPDEENPDLLSVKVRVLRKRWLGLFKPTDIMYQFTSCPEGVKQVSDAVMSMTDCIPTLRLQKSELIYSPVEPAELNEEVESQVGDVVADLEEDEDTLRIWTSLDSR